MRRAHFPRGSPPGQSNHQVTGYGVSLGTPSAVLNAGLTDGHGGARTQTSSRPTNSYPSRHVFSGDGDNLVIHRGASEESEHTSHFVGRSIPPSLRSLTWLMNLMTEIYLALPFSSDDSPYFAPSRN